MEKKGFQIITSFFGEYGETVNQGRIFSRREFISENELSKARLYYTDDGKRFDYLIDDMQYCTLLHLQMQKHAHTRTHEYCASSTF